MRQSYLLGKLRGACCARDHRIHGDVARVTRRGRSGVGVHHLRQQLLVQAAPIDADANRFSLVDRDLHDRAEVVVAPFGADVARIDAVLGEGARAGGVLREQQVAVVVEVPDHGDVDLLDDGGDGAGGGVVVDRHPHQLAPRFMEGPHLRHRRRHVSGVGVGHGLNDDRMGAAHRHAAHGGRYGGASGAHGGKI